MYVLVMIIMSHRGNDIEIQQSLSIILVGNFPQHVFILTSNTDRILFPKLLTDAKDNQP